MITCQSRKIIVLSFAKLRDNGAQGVHKATSMCVKVSELCKRFTNYQHDRLDEMDQCLIPSVLIKILAEVKMPQLFSSKDFWLEMSN